MNAIAKQVPPRAADDREICGNRHAAAGTVLLAGMNPRPTPQISQPTPSTLCRRRVYELQDGRIFRRWVMKDLEPDVIPTCQGRPARTGRAARPAGRMDHQSRVRTARCALTPTHTSAQVLPGRPGQQDIRASRMSLQVRTRLDSVSIAREALELLPGPACGVADHARPSCPNPAVIGIGGVRQINSFSAN